MTRAGVYPGSFNPLTIAHLAIAEAAHHQRQLDRVDLAISRSALGKESADQPPFDLRVEIVRRTVDRLDWLGLVVTEQQLLVDIAAGYDLVIMGADKWQQVNDPVWYDGDATARDRALARLPDPAVAPRGGIDVPPHSLLDVSADLITEVSSTEARSGRLDLMAPEARAHAERTGLWLKD